MTHESENPMSANKAKPFPWLCPRCLKVDVVPHVTEYAIDVRHDGILHSLVIPDLAVPTCHACGERVFTSDVDERVSAALRARLGLLTPRQIQEGIQALGMRPSDLAARLGVATDTVSRWADGAQIQSRAMDNFLRVFFAVPEARAVLTGPGQDPGIGAHAVVS